MSTHNKQSSDDRVSIPLSTAPYPILTAIIVVFYFVLLFTSWELPEPEEDIYYLSISIYILAIVFPFAYLACKRGYFLKRTAPPIKFLEDSLSLPKKISSSKTVRIPYKNIVALAYRGEGKHAFYSIDSKKHTIHLPRHSFVSDDDWLSVHHLLLKRLQSSNQLPEIHALIKEQELLRASIVERKPLVTVLLLIVLLTIFTVQHASKTHLFSYLAGIGANSQLLVYQGDWYRLLSAGLLHSGYVHLSFNLLGLFVLGYLIERLIGSTRFLLIFLVSVFGGNLCSALGGAVLTVGASSGIFGLFGAFFFLHGAHHRELPSGFRIPFRWWWYIAIVDLMLPVLIPKIDLYAHAGGFTSGFLCSILLVGKAPLRNLEAPNKGIWASLTLVFLTYAAAINWAYHDLNSTKKRAMANLQVMQFAYARGGSLSGELNSFAWTHAISRTAFKEELLFALKAIDRAVTLEDSTNIRDTRATIYYRLGRFQDAIDEEIALYEESLADGKEYEISFFGAQLLRFFDELPDTPALSYEETLLADCQLDVVKSKESLRFVRTTGCYESMVLYILERSQEAESRCLRVPFPSNQHELTLTLHDSFQSIPVYVRTMKQGLDTKEVIELDDIVRAYPRSTPLLSLVSTD